MTKPVGPATTRDAPTDETPQRTSGSERNAEQTGEAPADPVEMADRRRVAGKDDDVSVADDGTVTQKPHGNMDETLLAKGKDHPEQGPYTPEHDHVDPDLEPASERGEPAPKEPRSGTP